jgi:hypothetical protein
MYRKKVVLNLESTFPIRLTDWLLVEVALLLFGLTKNKISLTISG